MKNLTIWALSDLHGYINSFDIPLRDSFDIAIIAGDLIPISIQNDYSASIQWMMENFSDFVKDIGKPTWICLGNHDLVFDSKYLKPGVQNYLSWDKKIKEISPSLPSNAHLMLNSGFEICGKVGMYFSPYVPNLPNFAFSKTEAEIRDEMNSIYKSTDILVTHGPPYGILDGYQKYGSTAIANKLIYNRDNIRLHIFGHVHSDFGSVKRNDVTFVNCSIVDDSYFPCRKGMLITYTNDDIKVEEL